MERLQGPCGPGLGEPCVFGPGCRWELSWGVKVGLSGGRAGSAERRGGGQTAAGPAGGAGVFWESGGLCWGFLEDTAGVGLLGLAWELGERGRGARCLCVCLCAHSCVITCVCHRVRIAGSPVSSPAWLLPSTSGDAGEGLEPHCCPPHPLIYFLVLGSSQSWPRPQHAHSILTALLGAAGRHPIKVAPLTETKQNNAGDTSQPLPQPVRV